MHATVEYTFDMLPFGNVQIPIPTNYYTFIVCDPQERAYISGLCSLAGLDLPLMYAVMRHNSLHKECDVKIPIEFMTRNLRLLTLADHVAVFRQEGFMEELKNILEKVPK